MNEIHARCLSAGKFTSRDSWIHPARVIGSDELLFVTKGRFGMMENGVPYYLEPGSVLLLEAGKPHSGTGTEEGEVSFYWVHFEHIPPESLSVPDKCFLLREPAAVSLLFRQLLHYSAGSAPACLADDLLEVILYEVSAQRDALHACGWEPAMQIMEWIRINSDRALTVDAVSEKFGYNADYISRMFQKQFHISLKGAIDRNRIQHIQYLLLETGLTLAQLADRTGFGDYKLFLKYFKYHTGMSPTDFRTAYYMMHTNNR